MLGLALVWRSALVLRFMELMSTWVSTRKLMKPVETPHFIEQAVTRRPVLLGVVVTLTALASMFALVGIDEQVFRRLLFDTLSSRLGTVMVLATKNILPVGNAFAAVMGVLMVFAPAVFSGIEAYADK